jgi:phospholipid/cholesterol/gamma-HCH transport system ATP-binding protein
MAAVVELIDVHKSFDSTPVLRGISLTVAKGETHVVMGGSGSGKTVMLRLAAGLIRPDSGQILLFGVGIERLSEEQLLPLRRRLGYVFQASALFDSLSVFENVAYSLRERRRLPERELRERVVRNLALVGLGEEVLPVLPAELSGGMRKRVGIARALAGEPELLLFDEPTAGLDPTNAKLVADLIAHLRRGVCDTALVVTHDFQLTRAIADRVSILIRGQCAVTGPTETVLASPSADVQAFLTGQSARGAGEHRAAGEGRGTRP